MVFRLYRLLLLFVCISLSQPYAVATENKLPHLYQKLIPSVVTLHTFESVIEDRTIKSPIRSNGLGSGVIISNDGLILTAAHVIHSVDGIHVEFSNGEKRIGKIISSLPWADLALIKVNNLPKEVFVAELGDSNKVMVGEKVFALGAPLGLNKTLTVGYISGRHEKGSSQFAPLSEFFQTDAAINPGNSGGPLFSMGGKIIGISSYIESQSGGSEGLGFAVTSDSIQSLILSRAHFWSGMELKVLSKEVSAALHLPEEIGVLVEKVAIESAAYKAGVQGGTMQAVIDNTPLILGGDIILSLNGVLFNRSKDILGVMDWLQNLRKEDKIEFEVWRHGRRVKLTLKERYR